MPHIIIYLLILIPTFLLFLFLGYVFHWFMHQKWAGPFYHKHQSHHELIYPKHKLLSKSYISAGKDNSTLLFAILFAPVVLLAIGLTVFKVIPLVLGILIFVQMAIV